MFSNVIQRKTPLIANPIHTMARADGGASVKAQRQLDKSKHRPFSLIQLALQLSYGAVGPSGHQRTQGYATRKQIRKRHHGFYGYQPEIRADILKYLAVTFKYNPRQGTIRA